MPNYTVKQVEPVMTGSDVQARRFTLAAGEAIPWHYHSVASDVYVGLAGLVEIETRAPRAHHRLAPGEMATVPPKTAHRVANRGETDCSFLLLQGVGAYDFVPLGG